MKRIHEVKVTACGESKALQLATLRLQAMQKWNRRTAVDGQYLVIQTLKQDQDQETEFGTHHRLKFLVLDGSGRFRETWFNYGPRTRDAEKRAVCSILGLKESQMQDAGARIEALNKLVGKIVHGSELNNDTVRLTADQPIPFDPDASDSESSTQQLKTAKAKAAKGSRAQRRANAEFARYEKLEKQRKIHVI
ncbi:MAG: hypothetical protein V4807_12135 [Burkholderia gladioli]